MNSNLKINLIVVGKEFHAGSVKVVAVINFVSIICLDTMFHDLGEKCESTT